MPHSHFVHVLSLKSFSKGVEVHSIIWGVMAIVQGNMICGDLQTELHNTSHKYLAVGAGKGYWNRIIVHRQFNFLYIYIYYIYIYIFIYIYIIDLQSWIIWSGIWFAELDYLVEDIYCYSEFHASCKAIRQLSKITDTWQYMQKYCSSLSIEHFNSWWSLQFIIFLYIYIKIYIYRYILYYNRYI